MFDRTEDIARLEKGSLIIHETTLIQDLNHIQVWNLLWSAKKVVIFCGSGISLFSPTNFPTGQEISKACIDKINSQFKSFHLPNQDLVDLGKIPLEFLLGLATERKNVENLSGCLNKLSAFWKNAKYNRLHLLLASLLLFHRQCHIITTNYDIGLEEALGYFEQHLKVKPKEKIDIYCRSTIGTIREVKKNTIFKIHGCSLLDPPSSLIYTIKQESVGFPKAFSKVLSSLFNNSVVGFMGYSASEPDCLEFLLSVDHYSAIWIDKDKTSFENNSRAKIILASAKNAYKAFDLLPFFTESATLFVPHHLSTVANLINGKTTNALDAFKRRQVIKRCFAIYEKLVEQEKSANIIELAIQGFLQLRNFRKVNELLSIYRKDLNHSGYFYLIWKASIKRDLNDDWGNACKKFRQAAQFPSINRIEYINAYFEQLGLETLLAQNDEQWLLKVENRIRDLIPKLHYELMICKEDDRLDWIRLLGSIEKVLVQNLSYRKTMTDQIIEEARSVCIDAIDHLVQSGDINRRLEAERFLSRIFLRKYSITKNLDDLIKALEIAKKVSLLFSLMGIEMGIINSLRQYALILVIAKRYSEANNIILSLHNRLQNSPDQFSKAKVAGLELLLSIKTKKIFGSLRSIYNFVISAKHFSKSKSIGKNIYMAFSWYFATIKGSSG